MSSEQNIPEVQAHQGPPAPPVSQDQSTYNGGQSSPHGMGQSKSSRRRRRKRKNKGSEFAGGGPIEGSEPDPAGPEAGSVVPSINASTTAPGSNGAASPGSFGGGTAHQGNGAGAKRWKKKFRDRDRGGRREDNPGNVASGSSNGSHSYSNGGGGRDQGSRDTNTHQFGNRSDGFKRKGGGGGGSKGRDRSRGGFVGPMDHSYRAVNGNFADAPPSTIDQGNFGGRSGGHRSSSYHASSDSQPIDYSQGRSVPIPEDAPTRIYFFIEDLFLIAKIQETSRKLGVKVAFIKNDKESLAQLTGVEEENRPGLVAIDLNNANAKPLTLITKLKTKFKRSTSIIGFLSQVQADLKAKAVEAGCDTVMARSAFSQNLPNLLRRYGLEEEEESNFNY